MTKDLVIIGGGPAGIAAAISAFDNGIKDILVIEREDRAGGVLKQCIHNGFGLTRFGENLTGPEYADKFITQANARGIEILTDTFVLSISDEKEVTFTNTSGIKTVKAKAIILAMGCRERSKGALNIAGARPSGIFSAGTAQKYVNINGVMPGKRVVILGSGDIGLIMARRMTLEGAKVMGVAEIMPYSNGLSRNIVQCLNDFDIPLYLSHTVKEVKGKDHVEKVVIAKVDEQFNYIEDSELIFDVDTLILSVGLVPYNTLLEKIGVQMASTKGAVVDEFCQTSIPGIFACGNTLHVHDLVDYVTDEAKLAGLGAARYLQHHFNILTNETQTISGNGINYIIPQKYHFDNIQEEIIFKFRVKKPFHHVELILKEDDKIIKKMNKQHLLPAEMETIKLNKSLLNPKANQLYFEIKEVDHERNDLY